MTEQVQELPAVTSVAPKESTKNTKNTESTGNAVRNFAVGVAHRLVPWLVPVGLIVFWQVASSLG